MIVVVVFVFFIVLPSLLSLCNVNCKLYRFIWLVFKLASKHFVLFLKAAIFFPRVSQLISL